MCLHLYLKQVIVSKTSQNLNILGTSIGALGQVLGLLVPQAALKNVEKMQRVDILNSEAKLDMVQI
jgi:hypothetical protein